MLPLSPIGAVSAVNSQASAASASHSINAQSFSDMLARGIADVETRVANADQLLQAYARGDAVPIHQVTLALEQARVAVELAVQVRTRLVETYRDFMNMQL